MAILTNVKVIGNEIEMIYWIDDQKKVVNYTKKTMTPYAMQAAATLIKAAKANPKPSVSVDIDNF